MEGHARTAAERSGALVLKLWPTRAGLPDRLVLAPGGKLVFIEWKTATGRVKPAQSHMFARLAALGFPVTVVRSQAEFRQALDKLR